MALDYFTVYERFVAYLAEQAAKEARRADQGADSKSEERAA